MSQAVEELHLNRCYCCLPQRHQPACLCRPVAGGGGGSGQRREGELDGIDMDFDDTQVEVQLEGVTHSSLCKLCWDMSTAV